MAGITAEGIEILTADDIRRQFEAKERDRIAPNLVFAADDPIGQMNGVMAEAFGELWALAQAVVASRDPDAAEGRALDSIAAITGTPRRGPTPSQTPALVTIAPGTYPAGTLIARTADVTARFQNQSDVTNPGVSPAAIPCIFVAQADGPTEALSGTMTVMVSSVAGWTAVTNTQDAALGHLTDDDPTLRVRREEGLSLAGGSTVDGLVADLLVIEAIVSVLPLENVTMVTDVVTGVPAKSFELVVYDGTDGGTGITDLEIANVIWAGKPGGIDTYGAITQPVFDIRGDVRNVRFSRPTTVEPYLIVNVSVSAAKGWVSAGGASAASLRQRLVDWGRENLGVGDELVISKLNVPVFAEPGVDDVVDIFAGLSPFPTLSDNLVPGLRERFRLDSARITVNEVP